MAPHWAKHLFLTFIFGVLLFAVFILLNGEGGLSGSDKAGFYAHTKNFKPSKNSIYSYPTQPLTSTDFNSSIFEESKVLTSSTDSKSSVNPIRHNPTKSKVNYTRNLQSEKETYTGAGESKSNWSPVHYLSSSVKVKNSTGGGSAGNMNFGISRSKGFSSISSHNLAMASKGNTGDNSMASSDLNTATPRQSVFILPGTGGNANGHDAVPIADGLWILLLFAGLYSVFKLYKMNWQLYFKKRK